MESPINLRRQAFLYSVPALMITSRFSESSLFVLSIPSSMAAFAIRDMKMKMCVSNVLFIASLMFPRMYFVCYGFSIGTVYTSIGSLCLGKMRSDGLRIGIVAESIGLFVSLCYTINPVVCLVMAIMQFVNIYYLDLPPVESQDHREAYSKMNKLLKGASFSDRASEYKAIVGKENDVLMFRADFLMPMMMSSLPNVLKAVVCCTSLVFIKKSYWMCFMMYSFVILSSRWICAILAFFCDFVPGHPVYRLVSAQVLHMALK
ncbi:hypothetical protein CWI42_010920 [Ordospora colligata]|uniref:Uncharacterized protein n=1 Tax=Ordospora colligata OC4 TaxID=1354746 RepID=A0A0B2UMD7_9MICR|nr:uncharacterized protein M896_010920 [Ordospora colligata OC4]KHN70439.1 hypothetical protein M896_010920 [Ordospora colligata OC4]TBU17189.1 hypothetical protein CWI41_010920 [Ordospora colligata]TBU19619.1 hypothetical protein CWI42_010920 [Ordospora colligata]